MRSLVFTLQYLWSIDAVSGNFSYLKLQYNIKRRNGQLVPKSFQTDLGSEICERLDVQVCGVGTRHAFSEVELQSSQRVGRDSGDSVTCTFYNTTVINILQ